jgi:hypothetical protein
MMKLRKQILLLVVGVICLGGAGLRLVDLTQSAVRSDEINFMRVAAEESSLVELWRNPPWQNQMPLADSFSALWAKVQPQRTVTEGLVREPFALLGCLTVLICIVWLWRNRGIRPVLLASVWLGLSPFLVYHSREAYYYAAGMFFSTGMLFATIAGLVKLERGTALRARDWVLWMVWTFLACMSHMAIWVLAGVMALLLGYAGWKYLRGAERRGFFKWALVINGLLLLLMSRWIWRAIGEIIKVSSNPTIAHIGNPFGWMAPRILPVFFGGANLFGLVLLLATLLVAGWNIWRCRRMKIAALGDPSMGWLTLAVWIGFGATLAYVAMTGGGAGKWVYFSAVAPALMVWAVGVWDQFWSRLGPKFHAWGMAGSALVIGMVLAFPAWQVTRLAGKPTAYRKIRATLDALLAPGDVALVDRWLEPWNEMALYAPSNVVVTFTIPDEPYEQYVQHDWRGVTRGVIERNGAQAFIRLARNHEQRMGLWTWPETRFRHRAVVTNAAGAWLRDTGFAPMEEFYTAYSRIETEIFYDTHADIAERARAAGQPTVRFFGRGWQVFKPWQQGDFNDYRVLPGGVGAEMELWNLRSGPMRARLDVTGAGTGTPQVVQVGKSPALAFAPGQLERKSLEIELPPGVSMIPWQNRSGGGALLVQDVRIEAQP